MLRKPVLAAMIAALLFASAANGFAQEPTLGELIDRVAAENQQVCLDAVDALAALGPEAEEAVPALVTALKNRDDQVCWRVARTLGAIGPEAAPAIPALRKRLGDENALVRAYAAYALGQIGKPSEVAIQELAPLIADDEAVVRRAAIRAIRSIKPDPELAAPVLAKVLEGSEPAVISEAMQAAVEAGERALPLLKQLLQKKKTRYWAVVVATELGEKAAPLTPGLVAALGDDDPETRLQAGIALGAVGTNNPEAIAQLAKVAASDPVEAPRVAATYALGKLKAKSAAESVAKVADSENPLLSLVGSWALAELKPADTEVAKEAVAKMLAGVKSEEPNLRRVAARAMIESSIPKELARPAVIEALQTADPDVIAQVSEAFAAMGVEAVPKLARALESDKLRPYVVPILLRLGPEAKEAVPALIAAFKDSEDPDLRREIVYSLALIGPPSEPAVELLIENLSSEDPELRSVSTYALGKIGPSAKEAVPTLRKALRTQPQLRLGAVWALLQIDGRDPKLRVFAVPVLVKALDDERELVRVEAATELGKLGPAAIPAVPRLEKLVADDESKLVQDAARAAIAAIKRPPVPLPPR